MAFAPQLAANPWLVAGVVAATTAVLLLVLRRVIPHVTRRAGRGEGVVDDVIAAAVGRVRGWSVVLIAMLVGLQLAPVSDEIRTTGATFLVILAVLVLATSLDAGIQHGLQRTRRRNDVDRQVLGTIRAIGLLGKLIIWVTALLLVLANLGVDVTSLVATLGIGGIALALAAQAVLRDLFASVAIVGDRPFVEGDFIRVGDFSGTVVQIGIKTTRLRSLGGEQVIFPNSDLVSSRISNFGRIEQRRGTVSVHLPLETSPTILSQFAAALTAIVNATPGASCKRAYLIDRTATSFLFAVDYKMEGRDFEAFRAANQHINIQIQQWLADHGIAPGYPAQTMHLLEGNPTIPREKRPRREPRVPQA